MMHPSSKSGGVPAVAVKAMGMSYPWGRLVAGLGVLLLVAVVAAGIGSVRIPVFDTVRIVLDGFPGIEFARTWEESSETILWQLRLPRIVLAGIVGAGLSMSGATYQG